MNVLGDFPRFTVIIPTKDRAAYLHQTLRTCSLQDYENLEVIVSDDGSTDDTREVVEEAGRKDPRIRYVSPGADVGMRWNFEYALGQVAPGYVLALGGDDGLLPYSVSRMLEILRESGTELLAWPAPAFFYPGTRAVTAQLILHARYGRLRRGRKIIRSREFLERQVRELNYVSDIEAPMFYVKGVVSTELIEKVRGRSPDGQFFTCATPDGYSGIVLAGEVETFAFCGEPLTIHGVSPTSHGVGYLAGNEQAKKQSQDFFRHAVNRPMHRELAGQPYSPLIPLMTADYLLTARDLPGWPGSFSPIDYRVLLRRSLADLSDGQFAEDRVARELSILYRIAEQHGLGAFFRSAVRRARRNLRTPLERNALSARRVYIDASEYGIRNVFDAAYVAHYLHQVVPKLTLSTLWGVASNSLHYWLKTVRRRDRLPDEQAWLNQE